MCGPTVRLVPFGRIFYVSSMGASINRQGQRYWDDIVYTKKATHSCVYFVRVCVCFFRSVFCCCLVSSTQSRTMIPKYLKWISNRDHSLPIVSSNVERCELKQTKNAAPSLQNRALLFSWFVQCLQRQPNNVPKISEVYLELRPFPVRCQFERGTECT